MDLIKNQYTKKKFKFQLDEFDIDFRLLEEYFEKNVIFCGFLEVFL